MSHDPPDPDALREQIDAFKPAQVDPGRAGVISAAAAARAWKEAAWQQPKYPREEVEAAYTEYVRRANINDWDLWCDIFTSDVLYIDHYAGVFRSREDVRKWMVPLMASQPEMRFISDWHVISGDLLINYNWNRWPNPDASGEPYDDWETPATGDVYRYQFPCVTINIYGGNGEFCYEEDLYSEAAFVQTMADWKAEMPKSGRR